MKDARKIGAVVEEAVKILEDHPHLKYYQAIEKAKEALGFGGKIQKFNKSNQH